MAAHIESKKEDIAKLVLMPGDPLRAKMISEKFLEDAKLVNDVRGMLAYTGFYKGVEVTVFASGMGIPSIGIYAYELFHFYDVEKIIRIGSSGSMNESVRVGDIVLADTATCCSCFPKLFRSDGRKCFSASYGLNQKIIDTAKEKNQEIKAGDIITSDVFDVYVDSEKFIENFPPKNYLATEMEAACLFYLAELEQKQAACLLTVVDSKYQPDVIITPEERQNSLFDMISLALDAIIK